jgi:probable blue pigment (indigoidine) exporter
VWWRSALLGAMNVGAFFALIYLAAQQLPTSVASTIMAASPIALMLMAWALMAERPQVIPLTGAAIGIAGVAIMLLGGGGSISALGVAASVAAMLMSAAGYVLAKRWSGDVDLLASTAWQLLAGELLSWRQLLGMTLVLGAILIGRLRPGQRLGHVKRHVEARRSAIGQRVARAVQRA